MHKRLHIIIMAVCLGLSCTGLELTRDPSVPPHTTSGVTCGVLRCVESLDSTMPAPGADQTDTTAPPWTISSMTFFRKSQRTSTAKSQRGEVLAALTLQEPLITQESRGMKIEGLLTKRQATMRLEMARDDDCAADVSCRVTLVDSTGRELERTASLSQSPPRREPLDKDGGLISAGTLFQLLSQVQEMHTQMALVSAQSGQWAARLDTLERSLESKVDSLERSLEGKLYSLEKFLGDKTHDLEIQISLVENRMEDKLEGLGDKVVSLQQRVGEEICGESRQGDLDSLKSRLKSQKDHQTSDNSYRLDRKTSTASNDSGLAEAMKKDLEDGLIMMKEIKTDQEQMLARILAAREDAVDILNGSFVDFCGKRDQLMDVYLAETINKTCSVSEDLQKSVKQYFRTLQTDIQDSVQRILLRINTTATAVTSLPTICEKGMEPLVTEPPFPYPVLRPSGDLGDDDHAGPYLCDTLTDGGGWIVIQRRSTGTVSFARSWEEYKSGFGSLAEDFWLGNSRIHALTSTGRWELRVELTVDSKPVYANYESFSLGDEGSRYALEVGQYTGTAGESLIYHSGEPFSTYDRDNDNNVGYHCGSLYGAWWHVQKANLCYQSNLNGKWAEKGAAGLKWYGAGSTKIATFTEMKIRQTS